MKKIIRIWKALPDGLRRVLHAMWQTGLAAIIVALLNKQSTFDMRGLLMVGWAAAFASLKAYLVNLAQ